MKGVYILNMIINKVSYLYIDEIRGLRSYLYIDESIGF